MSKFYSSNLLLHEIFGLLFLVLGCSQSVGPKPAIPSSGGTGGGDRYFETVKKAFETNCSSCHGAPFQGAGGAPLSIYVYEAAKKMLGRGVAGDANELMYYIRNQIPHLGGDRCAGDADASPCSEVRNWWAQEFQVPSEASPLPPIGRLALIDIDGSVQGWAMDLSVTSQSNPIVVKFYVDAPKETGLLVGEARADGKYPGLSFPGDHGFRFRIPDIVRSGKPRKLFLYGVDANDQTVVELTSSPKTFTLFAPSEEGRRFYTNSVLPTLNQCSRCHEGSGMYGYESAFLYYLNIPSPAMGGSPTNNLLYGKASGTFSHTGGNLCGGNRDRSPCAEIVQWWNIEFR